MSFNFSGSDILSTRVDSLMNEDERRPYEAFVSSYGDTLNSRPCPFCRTRPRRFYQETIWTLGNQLR
jgi:hypothetical protein